MSQVLRSITHRVRNIQSEKNKGRRTLQELQVSADDYNQLVPLPMAEKNVKKAALDETFKVPVVDNPLEKENAVVRRSKRKNAVLDGPPKEVPPPKSQKQKVVKKPSKGKKGAAKKGDTQLPAANQTTLNAFVFASSIKPETTVSSELETTTLPKVKEEKYVPSVVVQSSENGDPEETITDCATNPTDLTFFHKSLSEGVDLLSPGVSESYWKEIAEQRRIALDKTLYENAQLHDQLNALETENSQLKSLLEECEIVIQSVRGSLV